MPDAEWMAPKEAARYLDISRTTLYRWAREGRVKWYVGPSGRRRFRRSDLDRLLRPGRPGG